MTVSNNSKPSRNSGISTRRRQQAIRLSEPLQTVLDNANITAWDVVLIGDGSGQGWETPNGWACCLIDRETKGRRLFYGATNQGSVNLAELLPYLQSLCWFHNAYGHDRLKSRGTLNVHIITDSNLTAVNGNLSANLSRDLPEGPWRPLWASIREYCRMGYRLTFHWCRRDTSDLNALADLIAGLTRRAVHAVLDSNDEAAIAARAANAVGRLVFVDPVTGEPVSPYLVNPDERPVVGDQ